MDRLERETFDPNYDSDMQDDQKAQFEVKYKEYRRDQEKKKKIRRKQSYYGTDSPIKNPCDHKELFSLEILVKDGQKNVYDQGIIK